MSQPCRTKQKKKRTQYLIRKIHDSTLFFFLWITVNINMVIKGKLHTIASLKKEAMIDEAIKRNWEFPNFAIKEIRDAIPSHCFHRDTQRSFSYLFHDASLIIIFGILSTYIDTISYIYARILLWPLYWVAQSNVAFGAWVIGHECGHQAFSPSKVRYD